MKILNVVGARPNFMKIAPIMEAFKDYNKNYVEDNKKIDFILVHTGQHYDKEMSKLFFENLEIPPPDIDLEVGSASHAIQTAEIMSRFEKVCLKESPTHILVVGDVNSTIACALVASKLGIKVIHVEAGLRSFDRTMPEEINRILTDAISDYLFTTEKSANINLRHEGVPEEKIYFVGNVMIDTLLRHKKKAAQSKILEKLGLIDLDSNKSKKLKTSTGISKLDRKTIPYAVLTLHRPSNVDDKSILSDIITSLNEISKELPIIFPIHPRTLNRIKEFKFETYFEWISDRSMKLANPHRGIYCHSPLGYLDFLNLISNSALVLTDSGGIQEETTILNIPCVTLRENTERPITAKEGTNMIAGTKKENIIKTAMKQLTTQNEQVKLMPPPLWDGQAANRIVKILAKEL